MPALWRAACSRVQRILRLYRFIRLAGSSIPWPREILILVVLAVYAAAILWMTSQRSRVALATLATGAGAGIALGAVM